MGQVGGVTTHVEEWIASCRGVDSAPQLGIGRQNCSQEKSSASIIRRSPEGQVGKKGVVRVGWRKREGVGE